MVMIRKRTKVVLMMGGVGWITPEVQKATAEKMLNITGIDEGVYENVKQHVLTLICYRTPRDPR